MASFDSNDDYIEVSTVISEAEDYESDIETLKDDIKDLEDQLEDEDATDEQVDLENQLEEKRNELEGLEEEAEPIIQLSMEVDIYENSSSLINESIWTDYVQQLAEDVDGINTSNWPYNCINWDEAAEDLRVDYATITFEGQDFYIRS